MAASQQRPLWTVGCGNGTYKPVVEQGFCWGGVLFLPPPAVCASERGGGKNSCT